MLRWLLLLGLAFSLVKGVQNGWVELHWGRLLRDAGVPFIGESGTGPSSNSAAGDDLPAVRQP